jgi:glutamyl-tRNA synthetase
MDDAELVRLIAPRLEAAGHTVDAAALARLEAGMAGLKPRATTLLDLAQSARFYVASRPVPLDDKAAALLSAEARVRLGCLASTLQALDAWDTPSLESLVREQAEALGVKLGQLAQPLRAALTGSSASPGIFEVMEALGRDEVLARLDDAVQKRHAAMQQSD